MRGGRVGAWLALVSMVAVLGCAVEPHRASRSPSVPIAGYRAPSATMATTTTERPAANGSAYTLFGELPPLGAMPGAWTALLGPPPAGAAPAPAPGWTWPQGLPVDPKTLPLPQGFTFPGLPGLAAPSAPQAAPSRPSAPGAAIALTQIEQQLLDETNLQRARGATCAPGNKYFPPAAPLVTHDGLQKTAREHSEDMARRNYFEHQNPEGEGPGPRGRRYGYNGIFTGENIHMGSTNARDAVASWMSSASGHCMNIMDERYHYFGGASAVGGSTYWTQNFGP